VIAFVGWMLAEHPTALFLALALVAYLGTKATVTLLYGYWLYQRSTGWAPRPETQRRLRTAARWTVYAFRGMSVMMGLLVAWAMVRYWTVPALPLLVGALVTMWWMVACLLKGAERVLRQWADTSEPQPVLTPQ
jgi:hypothetical protein